LENVSLDFRHKRLRDLLLMVGTEKARAQAMKQTFRLSLFQNKWDNKPQLVTRSWQQLCANFQRPQVRLEKDGLLFSPAYFEPALRRKENVKELSLLVLDIDHKAELQTLQTRLATLQCAFSIYSTHSHLRQTESNPEAEPRFRAVLPLAEPVQSDLFPTLWQYVKHATGLSLDESAKDASRIFYTPAIPQQDAPFCSYIADGAFLDWRVLLASHAENVSEQGTNEKDASDADYAPENSHFASHDERHAELCRRVEQRAKQNSHGAFEMKCPAHVGKGETSLVYFPDSQSVKCLKGCDYFSILRVFGLPDERLHNSSSGKQKAAQNVSTDWKMPELNDAALYGLAGRIVRTIEPHTEADLAALLVQLLAAFGALIGICAYFTAEADRHFTKIFAVLVGVSSNGRKGTSWGQIRRIMIRVEASFKDCIIDGLSSGEGLIYHVRDAQEKQVAIREKGKITGYQTEIVDEGAKEKRAFVIEPEFARVLDSISRKDNTLSSVIRQAWDSDTLRIMTKNPVKASNAQISIIGHITKTELAIKLNANEQANGFANRILWLFVSRSKYLPEGGALKESDLNFAVQALQKAVSFARAARELRRDEEARELWHEVYQRLADGHAGLFGAVTSRAVAQVMRLACIYALLDCSSVIRKAHLEAALALWQYCEDSARYIFGTATGDKLADKIYRALLEAKDKGLSRAELFDVCGHGTNADTLTRATKVLAEGGKARIKYELTDGAKKQTERWFALRFFPQEFKEVNPEPDTSDKPEEINSLNSCVQETAGTSDGKLFDVAPEREHKASNAWISDHTENEKTCENCNTRVESYSVKCPNCDEMPVPF
jgi:hypothetical protein